MKPIVVEPGEGQKFGEGMICRIPSHLTQGAFCAFETTLAPGEGIALHFHTRDDEVYYILDGELEMRCGEQTFTAKTGGMVVIPKTSHHAFCNRSDHPVRFLNFFLPGGFDDLVTEISQMSPEAAADQEERDRVRAKHGIYFVDSKDEES